MTIWLRCSTYPFRKDINNTVEETKFDTIEELVNHLANVEKDMSPTSTVLYRGQSDASWKLKSSLERQTNKPDNSIEVYERQLLKIRPEIFAFTGNDFKDDLSEHNGSLTQNSSPVYRPKDTMLMIYARQHGFPTPIIDWTESLYIALFFAFQTSLVSEQKEIAIFTYVVNEADADNSDFEFCLLPSNGGFCHKRHFTQQARYAYALRNIDGSWFYTSLETTNKKFFGTLNKFTLPPSQRDNGLDMLV